MSTYISRAKWGASPPVKTLPLSTKLKGVCLHWMGFHIEGDSIRLVKSIQRNHMSPPKSWWDLAYNEMIDQDGNVFEGRGLTHRSGAQGGTRNNKAYYALGLMVGPGQPPSDELVAAVRKRIKVIRTMQPSATAVVGHNELKATSCPGPDIDRMIRAGMFEPRPVDVPTPDPLPDLGPLKERVEAVEMEVDALYADIEALYEKTGANG